MASATATRAVLAAGPAHHAPERRTRSVSLATPACSAAQGVRLRSSTAFSARTLASTPSHRRAEHRSVATRKRRAVTTFASADAAAVAPEGGSGGGFTLLNVLKLVVVFAAWYGFNIFFNIYNKQLLKMFPYPISCTAFQFLGGSLLAATMWLLRVLEFPKGVTGKQLLQILPLAAIHTLGNTLTNISLGAVAVSFTHTIKASEPFFSAIFSAVFLGQVPTLPIIACLLPIVGGVALASFTEASFNMTGFVAAMASNLTFTSRNVLSKKMMSGSATKGLDNINLFSIITIMSFFLLTPCAMLLEGVRITPAAISSMGLDPLMIFQRLAASALCFHGYQQTSYMVLSKVTPVTHSIGNCVKRVVVIVSAVLFFQTPVSPINAFGTAMALGGVFAYTQVKRMSGEKM